jgi:hypothetical protein
MFKRIAPIIAIFIESLVEEDSPGFIKPIEIPA